MRRYFITGLFVLLPLVVTLYLLITGFLIIDGILGNIIATLVGRPVPGAGAGLTLLMILGTGMIATNVIGRRLIGLGERIFLRIPIVRNIYLGVKQLLDAFSNSTTKDSFKQVVMIQYPKNGVYSLAFVTSKSKGEIQSKISARCVTVFIPTTPNPTSGFFLVIPKEDCIYLRMSVEEAFKLIISGGVLVPVYELEKNI